MMTLTSKVDMDFYIRISYFNGYTKSGKIKWHKRKSVRANRILKLFSEDKLLWWYEKAIIKNKPFTAIKKECFKIVFYPVRGNALKSKTIKLFI